MKFKHPSLLLGAILLVAAGFAPDSRGQAILSPVFLTGNIHFSNVNPAILSLLNPPGEEGMSNLVVEAISLPPAAYRDSTSDFLPVTSRTSAAYEMTVDSSLPPGIEYSVAPRVVLQGIRQVYYFTPATNPPVITGIAPAPLNFTESVGVLTVRFINLAGQPVPVTGGHIYATDPVTGGYTGLLDGIPDGSTEQRIYLHGGQSHNLAIAIQLGTNYYTDRIDTALATNIVVAADDFTKLDMVIPGAQNLAKITGQVKMLREFELSVPGDTNQAVQYPNFTTVLANYGPFNSQRWAALGGANFTVPSSGSFTLSNVVPSTLDPASVGYQVSAQMVFRTNHNTEIFVTPALNAGPNPPLAVGEGAELSLSNLFVIDPGYLRGHILLQGPAESPGHSSLLRGVLHASDDDANHDGIPDSIGTYGIYWSTVEAVGVNRLGTGATLTADNGVGYGDFPGVYNPTTSAYEGNYELALGGLRGERSIWKRQYLSLTLSSGYVTNDNDYFYNVFYLTDNTTNDVEVVPGQPVTNDVSYCFSEVAIHFNSTTGTFYNPNVRASAGSFTGTNFLGNSADYSVILQAMYGTPNTAADATNTGLVVMYLPEGTYTLYPSVTPASGTYAVTGLAPITLNVGCGQRIAVETCLQLNLNAPATSKSPVVPVTGSVSSCGNDVAKITYSLNGGPAQVICTGCGANPSFAFNLTLTGECADNQLTVTATDVNGGISSVTTTLRYDATPPVIQTPADLVVPGCGTNGGVATFTVTATDNCSGPVNVSCTPPSGSSFPAGTNTVVCVATDASGNTSQSTFKVIVLGGSQLAIQSAVIVTWSCGGTLQVADDLNGPWVDVPGATSPYAAAVGSANKFYRVRN